MPQPERRPPVKMERREPRGVRLKDSEVEILKAEAAGEGMGWTTFARECLIEGLSMKQARRALEARGRITA
jgi:hypothetical protein